LTDHDAMRAARDRWLADPESAGTGKAFEAGWSARDEEVARECARRAAAEGRVQGLERALRPFAKLVERYDRVVDDDGKPVFKSDCQVVANFRDSADPAIIVIRDLRRAKRLLEANSPTPTGEATTEERTDELPGPDRR
jgi:hypothetical protein